MNAAFAVNHRDYASAWARLERVHHSKKETGFVENLCVLGITGAGKSTLLTAYAARYPRAQTTEGVRIPVLVVSIPARPTYKALASCLLRAMGAPLATLGNAEGLYDRFVKLAKTCGVEMIFLDEMQHLVDRGSTKSYTEVADKLKEVCKTLAVPTVLFGAPRTAILLESNKQLGRLFLPQIRLGPFSMTHEFDGMQGFILALADRLGIPDKHRLSSPEIAERIFYATDGVPAHIVTFGVSLKRVLVAKGGERAWTLTDLSNAFKDTIWIDAPDSCNPFCISEKTMLRRLTRRGEPHQPSVLDGDNHAPLDGRRRAGDKPPPDEETHGA